MNTKINPNTEIDAAKETSNKLMRKLSSDVCQTISSLKGLKSTSLLISQVYKQNGDMELSEKWFEFSGGLLGYISILEEIARLFDQTVYFSEILPISEFIDK